jgi:hypothetical protein
MIPKHSKACLEALIALKDALDGDIASLRKALTKLERERKATKT